MFRNTILQYRYVKMCLKTSGATLDIPDCVWHWESSRGGPGHSLYVTLPLIARYYKLLQCYTLRLAYMVNNKLAEGKQQFLWKSAHPHPLPFYNWRQCNSKGLLTTPTTAIQMQRPCFMSVRTHSVKSDQINKKTKKMLKNIWPLWTTQEARTGILHWV